MKLTKLETKFVEQIMESEYADWVDTPEPGYIGDWVVGPDYDMKVVRALITSLDKKKVIDIGEHMNSFEGKDMVWISIKPELLDFENYTLITERN
jgi:hypothetical protein